MTDYEKKGIVRKIEGERFLLTLSKQFYEKGAVMAAAYKFTDKCVIIIEPIEESYVGVWFQSKSGQDQSKIPELLNEFCNEVLDQQVRLDLEKRYGNLREIIVKHAFSPIQDLLKTPSE
jgi:His-Xaa-Ser system protein HxsD